MANQELHERSDRYNLSIVQDDKSHHIQNGQRRTTVENGETKVRVRCILEMVQKAVANHSHFCRECSTSPKYSSLRSHTCRAGKRWRCELLSSLSQDLASRCLFHLLLRNLQATLINGGPRALVWGILIVVAGALAQAASLAEMASAQPIAGAQYVCYTKT